MPVVAKLCRGALVALILAGVAAGQEDGFRWSWQEEAAKPDAPGASAESKPGPATPGTPRHSAATPGVDAALYAELLKENEALRRRIETAERERKAIEQANEKLAREVREREERIAGLTGLIETLNREKAKQAGDPDATDRLEKRLAEAEREKARLSESLTGLRDRERALQADLERQRAAADTARERRTAAPAVPADSDLYRDLEKEHRLLQRKLLELEQERARAVTARDRLLQHGAETDARVRQEAEERKRLEQELAEREKTDRQQKRVIAQLLRQVPEMEKELELLREDTMRERQFRGAAGDRLKTLQIELERRERQLAQAERMAQLLEESHAKVQRANRREQRDMHYNMAVVYARDGRYRDAKAEYLKALRLDPADADTHYNLGILYEEQFRDTRRAVRHYRRYLELNPASPDADKVRAWLMKLDQ